MLAGAAVIASLPSILRARPWSRVRSRLTPALAILTGGAAITFAAYLVFKARCGGIGCRPGAGGGLAGLDEWWRNRSGWQWAGQLLLASVALASASLAFFMSVRGVARARVPLWVARLLYVTWVALVFALPAASGLSER